MPFVNCQFSQPSTVTEEIPQSERIASIFESQLLPNFVRRFLRGSDILKPLSPDLRAVLVERSKRQSNLLYTQIGPVAQLKQNKDEDVQLFKGEDNQGRMFHTRRHLFDELDWIHPRYQRATGGLVASHVFLDSRARNEIVETIRSFHEHMFDERGVPHDWDKIAKRRSDREVGVDTSNFMEALTDCYRETGDRNFLEWALKMSRWTGEPWKVAGKRQGDDWNWNLMNYVLRGLVSCTLCFTTRWSLRAWPGSHRMATN